MPRPKQLRDLIALEGAPEFRVADWWDVYKEARVFYPRGYGSAMSEALLNSSRPIAARISDAEDALSRKTDWHRQYETKHWLKTAEGQVALAAREKPMLLSKIAVCLQALQLAAEANHVARFDVFNLVTVVPGAFKIHDLSHDVLNEFKLSAAFEVFAGRCAEELAIDRPDRVLFDIGEGLHVPHGVAVLLKEALPAGDKLIIRSAERPGASGVKAASEHIRWLR